jgi:hypothetical protein
MAQISAYRTQNREGRDRRRITLPRLASATLVASGIAIGGSLALYSLASAAGFIDQSVVLPSPVGMGPLSLASVAATAGLATLAAGVLQGVLAVTTSRPVRNFRILATGLALLSLSMPATIPGPSVAMRLTMGAMHLVVWAVSFGVLAGLATRSERSAA